MTYEFLRFFLSQLKGQSFFEIHMSVTVDFKDEIFELT